jgi:glutamate formiminotransferase/formiminotetrahydrofolate cyclodeaminase
VCQTSRRGRDPEIIRQITDAIASANGVSLLDVDPGETTNRTGRDLRWHHRRRQVEAAFRGIKMAAELIDMRKHKGAHPRMGATDVCPFIPIGDADWKEAVTCAKELGKRVGEELKIPVYLYEKAAKDESRANLAGDSGGRVRSFLRQNKKGGVAPGFRT